MYLVIRNNLILDDAEKGLTSLTFDNYSYHESRI